MLCPPIFQIPISDSVSMIFQIPIFFFVFVCVFGDGSHLFVTRSRCLPPIAFVRGAAFLIDICEDECVCVAKIALSFGVEVSPVDAQPIADWCCTRSTVDFF